MEKLNWRFSFLALACLLFISESNGFTMSQKPKQKVCIIGAGASGLTSAKQLADYAEEFDIIVYEQKSDVGGLWIYTDNIDKDEHDLPVQSSMYKYLRTNLPKELMAFPDYRNFRGEERSCVTHKTVLQYLRNYTEHFNLRQYIQFDTMVEKVTPILGNGDWRTTQWKIQTKNLNDDTIQETTCNAIMVCNGHYFNARIPKIPGIESFPGKVMHSHIYRKPEEFARKTVVILGASSSGIDISIEIAEYAEKVYLSHNKDKITSPLPSNIIQVAGVASANGSELTLVDGSKITADEFVFCTGYVFDYPFLDKTSKINVDDNQVQPLYKHLINIEHPSMSVVGLPLLVVHFPLFYAQASYFVSLLQGKMQLPSKEEMMKDVELHDKPKRYAHFLGDAQWDYNDELARLAGFETLPAFYRNGYQIWHKYRTANILHYKESNLRISDDGEIHLIHPNESSKHV